MRGAPQPGFSQPMRRISARTSGDTAGRPGLPRRTFQVQNIRNALRCQAITVLGCTKTSRPPLGPHLGEPNPQQAIRVVQWEAFLGRALKNSNLMAKGKVFQLQSGATFQQGWEHGERDGEPLQCRPKWFTECVQTSSSQSVRHLREAQCDSACPLYPTVTHCNRPLNRLADYLYTVRHSSALPEQLK